MDLERIWNTEIEILDHIDFFCKTHNLKYSLAYGTLIGAVRHKGFIPWDDDIDIMMPREDYNYLLANWDVSGYILQNKWTNDDYSQNYTKIRKDHTTFIQWEGEKQYTYHKGIFVDIFPGDRLAPAGLQRKMQYIYCAINLLYAREGVMARKLSIGERLLMMLPHAGRVKLFRWTDKQIQKWKENNAFPIFYPSTIRDAKIYFPANMFESMTNILFAGKQYMCVRDYDKILRDYYGDYMLLPPVDERVYTHHPVLVDFERNYEEIISSSENN